MKIARFIGRSWLGALLIPFLGSVPLSSCASEKQACKDSDCRGAERCVQDECRGPCETQDDCPIRQNCSAWQFRSGDMQNFCVTLDYAKNGRTGQSEPCRGDAECDVLRGYACLDGRCGLQRGQFHPCSEDSACDTGRGFQCIDGTCRVRCDSHFDCSAVGRCEARAGAAYCSVGQPAKAGQFYESCPSGGQDCDEGAGFVCIGAGAGDLDSYCTRSCSTDTECPDGFRCGAVGAAPCEAQCGEAAQPGPGCVETSEIGPGKGYECQGPLGLVRHVCRKREFCNSCTRDEDCFAVPGQICAKDASGEKICTMPCDPSVAACPWGDATECGVWDAERGVATCAHRFGSCRGSGLGCEPCVDALDCSKGYCTASSFTGEQYCVDLSVPCDCGVDADQNDTCLDHGCPKSPGGLSMICYSGSRFDGDPISHRCIGANSAASIASAQSGCWSR